MRTSRLVRFVSLWLLALGAYSPTALSQWTSVGDGIDYQAFTTTGPNNLFVARMARSNPNTTIDTSIAYDMMSGAKEIVRNQAARQDDAITWWGGSWGARNDVVVAINGGFYNTTTGVIDGGQVQSGWHSHWFPDKGAFSGFAWKTDRTAFHGECVDYTAAKVYVKFVANGASQAIDGINRDPGSSDLVIFTPQYDNQTPSGTRTEVLVEMSRPNLTTSGSGYSSGIIREVRQSTGSTWIPFDHLVLSAAGSEGTTLKNNSTVGAEVRIFQELVESNEPDVQGNYACQTATGVNWANVFAAINSNYHFLENGVVRVPDAVTHPGYLGYVNLNPRTAICWNSSYVFFVVCDGRSTQSVGMSCETLGNWAKTHPRGDGRREPRRGRVIHYGRQWGGDERGIGRERASSLQRRDDGERQAQDRLDGICRRADGDGERRCQHPAGAGRELRHLFHGERGGAGDGGEPPT